MTWKDDLRDIHRQCLDIERDENGEPTGSVCRKSRGHGRRSSDPWRRAHFDPDHGGVVWGLDEALDDDAEKLLDSILDSADRKLLDDLNEAIDVEAGLADLHRRASDDQDL